MSVGRSRTGSRKIGWARSTYRHSWFGRFDEATPALQEALRSGIHGAEWVLFDELSHTPHVEERERYMQVVGEWLARHD